jgi:WhiB family redox-sensing transcriptional regulator
VTAVGLFDALGAIPALPGARCRGKPHLFDGEDGPNGDRTRQAAQLCRRCPALERCRTWADQQPARALDGVIAGRLYTYAAHDSQRRWTTRNRDSETSRHAACYKTPIGHAAQMQHAVKQWYAGRGQPSKHAQQTSKPDSTAMTW